MIFAAQRPLLSKLCSLLVLPTLFFSTASAAAELQLTSTELSDMRLIESQITEYAYRWDGKDAAGFADLFTSDGAIERWSEGELISASVVTGQQAIYNYARQSHEGRLADRQTRHHMSNVKFLELSSDSALSSNVALITHKRHSDNAPFISGSGVYHISWRKTAEGWKMVKRILYSD